MKSAYFAYVLLLVCSSAPACELPALAVIPEKVADQLGVLRDVRRYSDSMILYAACVQAELAAAGGDAAPALQRSLLIARNNGAVAEHKTVTDLYAERVGPLDNLRLAEYLNGDGSDCVNGSWIDKTAVVNDGAVIFFVRNRQAYLSVLDAVCAGLARDGEFLVEPRMTTRVCHYDRIFPFREGSTRRTLGCGLGRFFPISEEQALQIIQRPGSPAASSEADARGRP